MSLSRRHFVRDISLMVASGVMVKTLSGCHQLSRYMDRSNESTPILIVDIDFNDEVIIRPQPITEKQVEQLVEHLYLNGVDVILLRMGYLGYLPYHTELSYPVGFDEDHARQNPFTSDSSVLEKWITQRKEWNERYRQVLETFNPPEIFIREGHKRGMKVIMWIDIFDDPYFGTNVVARYKNLWKELVNDNIADAFIVGDYEICSQQNHEYWSAKNLNPTPNSDLFSWSADYYQPYCNNKTKLYLFGEWLSASEPEIDKQLTEWSQRTLTNGFDGIDIHEAANFENPSTKMKLLKRMKQLLQGKTVEPLYLKSESRNYKYIIE